MKLLSLITLTLLSFSSCSGQDEGSRQADATIGLSHEGLDTATFAGGCFWCTEAVFEMVNGVVDVVSGYSGGKEDDPSYKEVSAGRTGHAEAIQIYYDPEIIGYDKLLEIFFATHDPTQLNRQGPDVGKQYRSAIFYHNDRQKAAAENYITELNDSKEFNKPIVTELNHYRKFYIAEGYHQDYYGNNPNDPYIITVTKPKVKKFMREYEEDIKK